MKRFVAVLALAVAAPALAAPIQLDSGFVEGTTLGSGVRAWMGIPFAAPPLRALRWQPPQPVANWTGVFHAERPAPMCIQPMRARTQNHYFGDEAVSEDCLYLNVWAPPQPAPEGKPYPVLVWIYGGAFSVGSASMANYSGEFLAAKGVVQVNLAYRVGALGFLAHPELTKEGKGVSGNYGLMDQIAGLEWVKRNIAAFGGDPNNVTIMGQSAGSMSVSALQQSPLAKGLFHKAIGMSGSNHAAPLDPVPLATAEAQGLKLQEALGAKSIEGMRDLPGDRVIAARVQRDPIVIDGKVLVASPQAAFAQKVQSDVPVMIGFTRDESFIQLPPAKTVTEYQAAVRAVFPDSAARVLKAYPVKSDADVARARADIQRDASVGRQTFRWASAQQRYGKAPVYGWLFTRRQPYAEGIRFSDHDPATAGAYHTGDVPYWLGTLDSLNMFRKTRDWTTEDRALADTMSGMIISFARSGVPSPAWPVFDLRRPKLMQLGLETGPIAWPHAEAIDGLAAAPNLPNPAAPAATRARD